MLVLIEFLILIVFGYLVFVAKNQRVAITALPRIPQIITVLPSYVETSRNRIECFSSVRTMKNARPPAASIRRI